MMIRSAPSSVLPIALLLGGCAAGQLGKQTGTPVADPAALVQELRLATAPTALQQINFAWTLDESGSRASGKGVVRVDAPERIRLDLFGPRGETYLIAALVDGDYRFPTLAPQPVELPSPALLWGALGIFEPPRGATLTSATAEAAGAEIRYQADSGEIFAYTFAQASDGRPGLVSLERAGPRGVIETVSVRRATDGSISEARYRDWSAFRDLVLQVETIRGVSSFPTNIWSPRADSQ